MLLIFPWFQMSRILVLLCCLIDGPSCWLYWFILCGLPWVDKVMLRAGGTKSLRVLTYSWIVGNWLRWLQFFPMLSIVSLTQLVYKSCELHPVKYRTFYSWAIFFPDTLGLQRMEDSFLFYSLISFPWRKQANHWNTLGKRHWRSRQASGSEYRNVQGDYTSKHNFPNDQISGVCVCC